MILQLKKEIATVYLVVMSVQIILLEGDQVSLVKTALMVLSPLFWFCFSPKFSKAVVYGGIYILCLWVSSVININSFRFETLFYRIAGVLTFVLFYNLVYCEKVFTRDYLLKVLKALIIAYTVAIILQQIAKIAFLGNSGFIPLNLLGDIYEGRGVLFANSLSLEPSHSARIVGALFLVLFRVYQTKYKYAIATLKAIIKDFKWGFIGFLWTMLSMDSGTAIIVIAILSLLFITKKTLIIILPFFFAIFYWCVTNLDFIPLQRVYSVVNAVSSMNIEEVRDADLSASARIVPFIYTLENLDLTKSEIWWGHGIDTAYSNDIWGVFRMIGGIDDYGFLAYIASLILIFKCCIRRFFSVETLFFIVVLMAEMRNVYVWWVVFMLFAASKYIQIVYPTISSSVNLSSESKIYHSSEQ